MTTPSTTASLPAIAVNEWVTGTAATEWASAILSALGAPETTANLDSMIAWFNSEQGGGANNPLNTTLQTAGSDGSVVSVSTGGTPAESYDTPADGVAATVQSIEQSGYSNILADLKAGTGLIGASNVSSDLSNWSGGGYTQVPAPYVTSSEEADADVTGPIATTGGAGGTGSAASGPVSESAVAAAGGFDPLSLLSDVTGLARDLATVIDYVFGMFGRGQGWRLAFTLVFAAAGYGAYRCLAGAGAVPDMGKPSLAVI
jgi:hypothetical protein